MPPEEIRSALRRRPFEAFSLRLTDGRALNVRHPDMVLLGRRVLVVGIPEIGTAEPFAERTETVDLVHVVSIEPLGQAVGKQD